MLCTRQRATPVDVPQFRVYYSERRSAMDNWDSVIVKDPNILNGTPLSRDASSAPIALRFPGAQPHPRTVPRKLIPLVRSKDCIQLLYGLGESILAGRNPCVLQFSSDKQPSTIVFVNLAVL